MKNKNIADLILKKQVSWDDYHTIGWHDDMSHTQLQKKIKDIIRIQKRKLETMYPLYRVEFISFTPEEDSWSTLEIGGVFFAFRFIERQPRSIDVVQIQFRGTMVEKNFTHV